MVHLLHRLYGVDAPENVSKLQSCKTKEYRNAT